MTKKDTSRHYVDNKHLYSEMVKYLNTLKEAEANGTPAPKIPHSVGDAIYKIANKLSNSPNFIGYSYKDEMISDGIENCIKYLYNFNPEKYDSPFNYFTTIIYYAFLRRISKEKKQQYIKNKVTINSAVFNNLVDLPAEDQSHFHANFISMDVDKLSTLVEKFEKTEMVPKKKKEKEGITKFIGDGDES